MNLNLYFNDKHFTLSSFSNNNITKNRDLIYKINNDVNTVEVINIAETDTKNIVNNIVYNNTYNSIKLKDLDKVTYSKLINLGYSDYELKLLNTLLYRHNNVNYLKKKNLDLMFGSNNNKSIQVYNGSIILNIFNETYQLDFSVNDGLNYHARFITYNYIMITMAILQLIYSLFLAIGLKNNSQIANYVSFH